MEKDKRIWIRPILLRHDFVKSRVEITRNGGKNNQPHSKGRPFRWRFKEFGANTFQQRKKGGTAVANVSCMTRNIKGEAKAKEGS